MLRARFKIPRFNLARAEAETQLAMLEIMREVAAKWVRRASFIPRVSGQARGAYLGLADAAQTSLTAPLPSTAINPRPTPRQSSRTGRAAQRHTLSATEFSLEIDLNYIKRWQSRWGNPIELARTFVEFDFEDALRSNENAFLPLKYLEFVEISSG